MSLIEYMELASRLEEHVLIIIGWSFIFYILILFFLGALTAHYEPEERPSIFPVLAVPVYLYLYSFFLSFRFPDDAYSNALAASIDVIGNAFLITSVITIVVIDFVINKVKTKNWFLLGLIYSLTGFVITNFVFSFY